MKVKQLLFWIYIQYPIEVIEQTTAFIIPADEHCL